MAILTGPQCVDDLSDVSSCTDAFLDADDTNILTNGKDNLVLQDLLNKKLAKISEWDKVNKLSHTSNKTPFMVFSRWKIVHPQIDIKIDDQSAVETYLANTLVFYIDKKLT